MKFFHHHWKYQNTSLLVLSLVFLYFVTQTPHLQAIISAIGSLGTFGIFLVGIFFVSSFTIAPAAVVLYHMAYIQDPYQLIFFAALGGVVGDYLIFKYLKNNVFHELVPLYDQFAARSHFHKIFSSPFFAWLTPVIGALIIASPLPDELGITMLGLSRMKTWQFVLLTFALDCLSVAMIVSLALVSHR